MIGRYQQKRQTLYDLDDIEKIGLLRRKTNSFVLNRPSTHSEFSDHEYLLRGNEGIQCSHCRFCSKWLWIGGFVNPKSTTVCRECNCILRGHDNIVNGIVG